MIRPPVALLFTLLSLGALLLPGAARAQSTNNDAAQAQTEVDAAQTVDGDDNDSAAGDETQAPQVAPPVLLGVVQLPRPDGLIEPGSPPIEVILELVIDEDGTVVDQVVTSSSGNEAIDAHALATAPLLEFYPAQMDGQPVTVTIEYPFRFLAQPPPEPVVPPARLSGRVEVKGSREDAAFVEIGVYPATPNREEPKKADHYDLADAPVVSVEAGEDGLFDFPDLPGGTYVVLITATGFKEAGFVEELPEGADREVLYRVLPTGLAETVVVARREDPNPERVLTRDELWKMPGAGGDPVAALTALPGVVQTPQNVATSVGDQTPVVRGANSEDSVAILDGLPTPILLHALSVESITGQFLVERAYLKPAAAEASFGDLTGAVVGIDTRSPRADRVGGFVQPGIGQAALALEGRITDRSRFYVGFKRSYFEILAGAFLPADAPIDFATFPFYQDQQAILEVDLSKALKLNIGYIGSLDGLELLTRPGEEDENEVAEEIFSRVANMHRIQAKLDLELPWGLRNRFQPAITWWGNELKFLDIISIRDRHTTFHLRDQLFLPLPKYVTFDAGVFLEVDNNRRTSTTPRFAREDTGPSAQIDSSPELSGSERQTRVWFGAWLGATFKPIDALSFTPEFRLDYWEQMNAAVPQVRGRIGIEPSEWMQVNIAGGRYVQSPSLDELNRVSGNPELDPEGAWHVNLGLVFDPAPWINIDLQGFAKFLDDQVVSSDGGDLFSDLGLGLGANPDDDDPTHGLSNSGKGRIYGMELFTRFGVTRGVGFSGWLGYSLTWAERKDFESEEWRWFQWDRRHQLTVLGRVQFPLEISLGAKFIFQTGAPTTPIEDSVYYADAGAFIPVFGETYSSRGLPYHQLDIRLDKKFRLKTHTLDLFVDITNVYAATQGEFVISSFDYREEATFTLIPIIDLGVRIEF